MNSKRNVYLNMKTIEEAKKILFDRFGGLVTRIETLDVAGSKDRVLAEPAVAAISSPNFHAAAMDGIAVDAKLTFGAGEEAPVTLVPGETAFWVNTGHALPRGTNSVIMIEHLNIIDDKTVEIEAPVFPRSEERRVG